MFFFSLFSHYYPLFSYFICAHASVSPVQVWVESPTRPCSPSSPTTQPYFCPLQKSYSLPPTSAPPTLTSDSPALSSSLDTQDPDLVPTPLTAATFSSPNSISALIVAPPSADAFFRAHRHSIPGHRLTNYLKFLHELAAQGSTIAHLFSTAVISGSSSAPNLQKEMPPQGENVGKLFDRLLK